MLDELASQTVSDLVSYFRASQAVFSALGLENNAIIIVLTLGNLPTAVKVLGSSTFCFV